MSSILITLFLVCWNDAGLSSYGTPWLHPHHQGMNAGPRHHLPHSRSNNTGGRHPNQNNFNSFPKHTGKRPANFGAEGSKGTKKAKIIKTDSVNASNSVIELKVGEGGEPNISITSISFSMKMEPTFFGTPGIERAAVVLPLLWGTVPEGFSGVANVPLTCSFLGLTCHSCNFRGGRHALNGRGGRETRRVFLIGDAFVPPHVGGENDCFGVLRIRGGSFSQAQDVLEAQVKNGLTISSGSFFVVSLLTHLCRVGSASFWSEFDLFEKWCKKQFNVSVLPTLPLFPKGLDDQHLISIEQFLKTLQGRYIGDMSGGTVGAYSLWRPFHLTMLNFEGKRVTQAVPPVNVKGKVILGGNQVWEGLEGDFSKGCPTPYVKFFFTQVIEEIKKLDGGSPLPLITPNAQSLDRGLGKGVANPCPTVGDANGNTLFLLGASILRGVEVALAPLVARFGIDTINLCKGGRVMDKFSNSELPSSQKPKDILILHLFGNYIFECIDFSLECGRYHLTCPQFLSDDEINLLINKAHIFISKVLANFNGIVKLVGPFPRHIDPCCAISIHQIDTPLYNLSNMQYVLYLSRFLEIHPLLRFPNLEFISFPSLLPKPLNESHFPDGVHLDAVANKHLANRLSQVISKKSKCPPTLTNDPTFSEWLATVREDTSSPDTSNMEVTENRGSVTDISLDLQLLQMEDDDLLEQDT